MLKFILARGIIRYSSKKEDSMNNKRGKSSLPEGFVVLSDIIPTAVIDLRYYSSDNFVGACIDGYETALALITEKAALALKGVSDNLSERGYLLRIYDAYRPARAVAHFLRWTHDIQNTKTKAIFYPDVDKSSLIEKGYIADSSGHSRGSSVDLTLIDKSTGMDLDMGGIFDFFGEISRPSYTKTLTKEQIENRNILRNAMMEGGFIPDNEEWWHFTLKGEPFPDTYFDFPITDEK